jgi:uncharacterized protein (TIGR02300 family)
MSRNDWGIKRHCLCCGTRFYDFDKSPIICPACNGEFDPEYLPKRKVKSLQGKDEDIISDIDVGVDDELVDDAVDDLEEEEDSVALNDGKN